MGQEMPLNTEKRQLSSGVRMRTILGARAGPWTGMMTAMARLLYSVTFCVFLL